MEKHYSSIEETPTDILLKMLKMEKYKKYHKGINDELKFRDFNLNWNEEKNMESFNEMTDSFKGV
jgi:hypothetical protein